MSHSDYEAGMRLFDIIDSSKGKAYHGATREGGMNLKLKQSLEGSKAAKLISLVHDAHDSLVSTILTLVENDDPRHNELYQVAITGTCLLDLCCNEAYTTLQVGVKQGFAQHKIAADGDGVKRYSHVVKLYTVQSCLPYIDRSNHANADKASITEASDTINGRFDSFYSISFPGTQTHRFLSLLEQHLSLGMPINPTPASFAEFLALPEPHYSGYQASAG